MLRGRGIEGCRVRRKEGRVELGYRDKEVGVKG